MALVAYGGSDDDITDSEDETEELTSVSKINSSSGSSTTQTNGTTLVEVNSSILAGMPAPKSTIQNQNEEELEDIVKRQFVSDLSKPTKKRGLVQISVPQLSKSFDSDEEDAIPVKRLNTAKASTFLTSLPAPKHMAVKEPGRKLIPYTLSKKQEEKAEKKNFKKTATNMVPLTVTESDDDDEEEHNSFFSLEADSRLKPAEVAPPLPPLEDKTSKKRTFQTEGSILAGPWQTTRAPMDSDPADSISKQQTAHSAAPEENLEHSWPAATVIPTEAEKLGISEEELLRLAGRRGRKKEAMNFVDVHADDGLDPSQIIKNMTQEQTHQSHKKGDDLPSGQQRRKHQITYLAFQAKEREQELQNQWAQNRLTKQQTQSKYGF